MYASHKLRQKSSQTRYAILYYLDFYNTINTLQPLEVQFLEFTDCLIICDLNKIKLDHEAL